MHASASPLDALDALFRPKSIAVIGASSEETSEGDGWVARLLTFGFSGKVYPVNPRADTILGLKAYPSAAELPEDIDYAIFNIPASSCLTALDECARKGVKLVHIYSAGFSEVGKAGERLEKALVQTAKEKGIRILGPNAMGLYFSAHGLTFDRSFPRTPGAIAFVSQSGSCAMRLVRQGSLRGLRFSKVVSYGNAADLNEAELANYFAMDQESRILAFYIEGTRDKEGFIEALRKAARAKPVFMLAGGTSIGGRRAVEAHTGKGTPLSRESLSRIPGVIIADSLEQLVDYLVAFSYPLPPGLRNVAVVGRGAGLGVLAADALEAEGFSVPSLSLRTRRAIAKDFSFPGAMIANPIEPPGSASTWAPFLDKVLPILDKAQEIDLLLLNLSPDIHASGLGSQDDLEAVAAVIMSAMERLKKPTVAVLASGDNIEVMEGIWSLMARLAALGIPVFYSVEAAARSIARSQRWREGR